MKRDENTLPSARAAQDERAQAEARLGVVYGVAAYLWWGLCPIYFKAVTSVPTFQVLAHRIIWSLAFLAILIVVQNRRRAIAAVARDRQAMLRLCGTTVLIATNWGLFIWAVANNELLQASLGYYINPLVNVLLGFVFLRERLRRMQTISVVLAGVGVAYMIFAYGQVPWIALVLAFSFGFYGLLRKTTNADPLVGLTVETSLLAPAALAFLVAAEMRGVGSFGHAWRMSTLLVSAGIVTAVPLLWFAAAAKRMRYVTLGLLLYLAPTGQFLLAVAAYGETFTHDHLITFAFIWTALILYSIDTAIQPRRPGR